MGIRTPDPHNAIVVLYQLSYDPIRTAANVNRALFLSKLKGMADPSVSRQAGDGGPAPQGLSPADPPPVTLWLELMSVMVKTVERVASQSAGWERRLR